MKSPAAFMQSASYWAAESILSQAAHRRVPGPFPFLEARPPDRSSQNGMHVSI